MVNRPRTRRAHHPTLLTAALAIALSAVIAPRNAQAARPALKAYSTRHYIVYTTLDRADAVPFGRHMDLVFDQYRRRFAAFGSADAPPMPLYLFSERAQYLSFLGGHGVDASNSGGMFVVRAGVRGLCTWVNGRGRSVTFDVLEHEGFHQFAYASIGRYLPVWANEGLAQYFEDGVLIGQSMHLGMVNDQRLRIVQAALRRNAPLITLDTLFDMTDANWAHVLSRDPAKSSLLYSYAWSVVYFLIHGEGGRYRAGFERYLSDVSGGTDSSVAFATALGVADTAQLRAKWAKYVLNLSPDALAAALERMSFLGTALQSVQQSKAPMPADLATLRQMLQRVQFRAVYATPGLQYELSAADESMYRFQTVRGGERPFDLLEPARGDLPPRITAPGMTPQPTLHWSRDKAGELVQELRFE